MVLMQAPPPACFPVSLLRHYTSITITGAFRQIQAIQRHNKTTSGSEPRFHVNEILDLK